MPTSREDHVLLSWDAKAGARRYRVQLSGTPELPRLVENVVTDNTSYAPLLQLSAADLAP